MWPPPSDELDALEVMHLTTASDDDSPTWALAVPGRRDLTASDLKRLAQLASRDATNVVVRNRALLDPASRHQIVRIGAMVALIAVALGVGAFLGARHARRAMLTQQSIDAAAPRAASSSTEASSATAPKPSTGTARDSSPTGTSATRSSAPPTSPATPPAATAAAARSTSAPNATAPTAAAASARPPSPQSTPSSVGVAPHPPAETSTASAARNTSTTRSGATNAAAPGTTASAAARPPSPRSTPSSVEVAPLPPAETSTESAARNTSATRSSATNAAALTGPAATLSLAAAEPTTGIGDTLEAMRPVSSPARRAEASGVVGRAADVAQIRQTLGRYEQAYDSLDARAARAVWPSLDVAALSRAFGSLKSQALTFDRCTVNSVGYDSATVSCAGSTTVVRRIGHPTPVVEPLQWVFTLQRDAGDWKIAAVRTSR